VTYLDEIRFSLQTIEDSRRVVLCHAYDLLVCELATADYPLVTVQQHQFLDPGTVYIVDPNALDAAAREAVQHSAPRHYEYRPAPWPDLRPWMGHWRHW
jgi:hypothetical protein